MRIQDMERKYYETVEEALEVKRNDPDWYLYHHIKNEDALIPVIIASFLSFFCNGGGWLVSICIWIWYFMYCHKNNNKLDNDPYIIKERQAYIELRLKRVKKK